MKTLEEWKKEKERLSSALVAVANRITMEQVFWQVGVRLPIAHFAGLHLSPRGPTQDDPKVLIFRTKFPNLANMFRSVLKVFATLRDSNLALTDMNDRASMGWSEIGSCVEGARRCKEGGYVGCRGVESLSGRFGGCQGCGEQARDQKWLHVGFRVRSGRKGGAAGGEVFSGGPVLTSGPQNTKRSPRPLRGCSAQNDRKKSIVAVG